MSAVSCQLLRLTQGSEASPDTLSSQAELLQETVLLAHSQAASPVLLQLLWKAEELLLCLQSASAHQLVCFPRLACCAWDAVDTITSNGAFHGCR